MNGEPWTIEADQDLRQWFANGRSNKELAKLTGRTVDAIVKHKGLLGLRGGSATCQRCGAPLKKKNGRPGNYCSRTCENWGSYEVKVGHKPMVEVKGVCAHCEKPFARMVRSKGHDAGQSGLSEYCSRDCDKAAWYLRQKSGPGSREFMRVRAERANVRNKRLRQAARSVQ